MIRWITVVVAWAARITGLLLVCLVVLMAIGEGGPPDFLRRPVPEQLEAAGMLLMLVGFLAGWRWEAVGCVMAVAGFALFLGTEMVVNGKPPSRAIPAVVVPGVLLLVSAGLRKAERTQKSVEWPERRSDSR